MAESEKVIVTGGAGFLGSHLVSRLLEEEFEVVVIDNLSIEANSSLVEHIDDINFWREDLTRCKHLPQYLAGATSIIHLAAMLGVQRVLERPADTITNNTLGTLRLLQSAAKLSVPHLILASSSEVYGEPVEVPTRETHPRNPIGPYAASKAWSEDAFQAFSRECGFDAVALRFFNIYGPRQNSSRYGFVVSRFITNALTNEPIEIYGDGKQSRDFSYVDDAVTAIVRAMKWTGGFEVFNIGTGVETTIRDLASEIIKVTGSESQIIHGNPRPEEIRRRVASVEQAQRHLGYKASVALETGLRYTVEDFQHQATQLGQALPFGRRGGPRKPAVMKT